MLISTIKLYRTNSGLYSVRIEHDGRIAKSVKHTNAPAAYRDAESRLVWKPGYVQSVPKEENRS